ncbi:MAG: AAA family ATPase [Candidatus Woesearchaeota archaeon]
MNNQIKRVENDLIESEKILNDFQSSNSSIDINLEVESIVKQLDALNLNLNSLETKKAELLALYLPSSTIITNIDNQILEIKSQQKENLSIIQSLPKKQQEYLKYARSVSLNKTSFETLLAKKVEFSLIEASTIGNARVIDQPYNDGKVYPKLFEFMTFFLILAVAVSLLYVFIKTYIFAKIVTPNEIKFFDTRIQIIGFIPHFNKTINTINDTDTLGIESLAANISLMDDLKDLDTKIIQIVSANPSAGKTTSSSIAAYNLSKLGKKVLLIDLDTYKGQVRKMFNIPREKKVKIEDLVSMNSFEDFKMEENLYVIPKPINSQGNIIRIFDSLTFKKFIDRLKENFEYIIIDTPPVLLKPDTLSLSKYTDIIVPVVRQGQSKIQELGLIRDSLKINNKDFNYVIYNGLRKLNSYYYGKYSYASYGYANYYSEDYENEDEKNE